MAVEEKCVVCGELGTVRETDSQGGSVRCQSYCRAHAESHIPQLQTLRQAEKRTKRKLINGADFIDRDVRGVVSALNRNEFVRTLCSCSGTHPGASGAYVALAPVASDTRSLKGFAAFVASLENQVKVCNLGDQVTIRINEAHSKDPLHSTEIRILNVARARELWATLSDLISVL